MIDITVRAGPRPTEFILVHPGGWFSPVGQSRASNRQPTSSGNWLRMRVYAISKFFECAPDELVAWLEQHGGVWTVRLFQPGRPDDDSGRDGACRYLALAFADTGTAMLFKLTWGGAGGELV